MTRHSWSYHTFPHGLTAASHLGYIWPWFGLVKTHLVCPWKKAWKYTKVEENCIFLHWFMCGSTKRFHSRMFGPYALKTVPDQSFYSRWWRVLSGGGMWVRRSVIIPLKLWLSANLRGIKDSVPLTTLCSVHCHCWWGTYSEEKLCNKCFATVRKLCNGTKDHATAQKTCNSTKNCAKVPKTMQRYQTKMQRY